MSLQAMVQVKWLTHAPNGEKFSASQKGVLMQMADDHNEDRGYCFPSIPKLALRVSLSEKQTRRIVKQLCANGTLEVRPVLREYNDGRMANDYRFWFDKPFDKAATSVTLKRLRLQELRVQERAMQLDFLPPPVDGRGTLPPTSLPPGQTSTPPPPADGRGGLPSMGGLQRLEQLPEQREEPLPGTTEDNPLPPSVKGVEITPEVSAERAAEDQRRWDAMKLKLKEDLISVPPQIVRAKRWKTVPPSEDAEPLGDGDFYTCFRDWWLIEAKRTPGMLLLITSALDYDATVLGLEKYSKRLIGMVRKYWALPEAARVHFSTVRHEPLEDAAENESPDVWELVKTELFGRLMRKTGREREDKLTWYREVVSPVVLREMSTEDAAAVWTLEASEPRRVEQMFARMRGDLQGALRKIAGADVQLRVVKAGEVV